jgi:hypothetical protein
MLLARPGVFAIVVHEATVKKLLFRNGRRNGHLGARFFLAGRRSSTVGHSARNA